MKNRPVRLAVDNGTNNVRDANVYNTILASDPENSSRAREQIIAVFQRYDRMVAGDPSPSGKKRAEAMLNRAGLHPESFSSPLWFIMDTALAAKDMNAAFELFDVLRLWKGSEGLHNGPEGMEQHVSFSLFKLFY